MSLLREINWGVIASVATKGSQLATILLLVKLLDADHFARYAFLTATAVMLASIVSFGIPSILSGLISAEDTHYNKNLLISTVIITNAIIGIIFLIITSLILFLIYIYSFEFIKFTELPVLLTALAINYNLNIQSVMIGCSNLKVYSTSSVIGSLVMFLLTIILATMYSINGAIFGYVIGSLFQAYISSILFFKNSDIEINVITYDSKIYKNELRKILTKAMPNYVSGWFNYPVLWFCGTVLYSGANGVANFTIYNLAEQIKQILTFIPNIVAQIIFPHLSKMWKHEPSYANSLVSKSLLFSPIATSFVAAPMLLFKDYLFGYFGQEYLTSSYILYFVVCISFLVNFNNILGGVFLSRAYWHAGMVFNIIWGCLLIVLVSMSNYFKFELPGFYSAFLIAYIFHTILQYMFWLHKRNSCC